MAKSRGTNVIKTCSPVTTATADALFKKKNRLQLIGVIKKNGKQSF